jgi:hypothetical protein
MLLHAGATDGVNMNRAMRIALCCAFMILVAACNRTGCKASPGLIAITTITHIHVAETRADTETGRYLRWTDLCRRYPDLIPPELWRGSRGYKYTVVVTQEGYTIRADPMPDGGGRRSFHSDDSGVIRQSWGPSPVDGNSPILR